MNKLIKIIFKSDVDETPTNEFINNNYTHVNLRDGGIIVSSDHNFDLPEIFIPYHEIMRLEFKK